MGSMECGSFQRNEIVCLANTFHSNFPFFQHPVHLEMLVASITSGYIYVVYLTVNPFCGSGLTNNLNVCLFPYCTHVDNAG